MDSLQKFNLIKDRIIECVEKSDGTGEGKYETQMFLEYPFDDSKWNMSGPIPSIDDLHTVYLGLVKNDYKKKREKEYGLLDSEAIEAMAEKLNGDSTLFDSYMIKRNEIKTRHPKPV